MSSESSPQEHESPLKDFTVSAPPVDDAPSTLVPTGPADAVTLVPNAPPEQAKLFRPDALSTHKAPEYRPDSSNLTALHSIPGYEILGELGRGGMGVVYKARQIGMGRVVALKMILSGNYVSADERSRFQSESRAIARLKHPGVVQVYEMGEHGGQPFFSLEYCEGGSLAARLAVTSQSPVEAARLMVQLAQAMQAAHEARVIHRDLKPANVLLTADGTPKITDFGLARKLDEVGHTATGAVMGTPAYMAPEQAQGKNRDAGPATDVYALGAILYECLTGRPPFRAATALDTILQVVGEDPIPPRQLRSEIPRDLEAICLKCLEKEPQRRYPSALALAHDLLHFLEGEPVSALQSGLVERLVGSLDRVQLESRFAQYGTLFLKLAPLFLLTDVWITVVMNLDWSKWLIGAAQLTRATVFLILVGQVQGWRWRPPARAERRLWAIWGGYVLCCYAMGLSSRVTYGFSDPLLEMKLYPAYSVLAALACFALLADYWGYFALVGVGFIALAFVMAYDLRWAALEYGLAWTGLMVFLGVRLRRLGKSAERQAKESM